MIEPESLERAHWVIGDAGGALSVSFLRQQTLAANIVCPGASTLLSNLLRSETLHLVSTADEHGNQNEGQFREIKSKSNRTKSKRNLFRPDNASDDENSSGDESSHTSSHTSHSSSSSSIRTGVPADSEWSYEYQWGMCHEMYPIDFTESFQGLKL